MIEFFTGLLLLTGSLLMLIAGLGILRMPDLPTRMHASSKAGALGGGLILLAVALYFEEGDVTARALAIVAFIIFTTPVAAHMLGRAAYFVGVPMWDKTVKDELRGRYDRKAHRLAGAPESTEKGEKRP